MDTIETCFGKDSVKEIMAALEEDGSEWATKRLDAMKAASPLSLAVRPLFRHIPAPQLLSCSR